MVAPVATHQLADLLAYVQRQFGDESGVQITVEDITRWCNQGQNEIINRNPFLEQNAITVLSTVPNGGIYPANFGLGNFPVPGDCVKIDNIWVAKIQLATLHNVQHIPKYVNFQEWTNTLGDLLGTESSAGFSKPLYWTEYANNITVYPYIVLDDSYAVELSIQYRCLPNKVAVPSDLLGIPDRYYDRLCEYVMSQAYMLDQDLDSYSRMKQEFEEKLQQITNAESDVNGAFQVISEYGWE